MMVNGPLCSFISYLVSRLSDLRRTFLSIRRCNSLVLHLYVSPQDTTLPSLTRELYVKVKRAGRAVGKKRLKETSALAEEPPAVGVDSPGVSQKSLTFSALLRLSASAYNASK